MHAQNGGEIELAQAFADRRVATNENWLAKGQGSYMKLNTVGTDQ